MHLTHIIQLRIYWEWVTSIIRIKLEIKLLVDYSSKMYLSSLIVVSILKFTVQRWSDWYTDIRYHSITYWSWGKLQRLKVVSLTHGGGSAEVHGSGGLSPDEAEQQQEQRWGRRHGDSDRRGKCRGPSVSADGPRVRSQKGDRAGRREFQARGTATKWDWVTLSCRLSMQVLHMSLPTDRPPL